MKSKSASKAGLADVEAAKRDLKEYGFLAWLEEHLQLRETKANLQSIRLDDFELGSTDNSGSDDTQSLNIEPDLNRDRKKMETTPIYTKVSDDRANLNSNNSKKLKLFNKLNCFLYKILEMFLLQRHSLHPVTTRKMLMTCLVKWFHRNQNSFPYVKKHT